MLEIATGASTESARLPPSHLRPAALMAGGFVTTFVVAVVSYELIGKRALRLKDRWRTAPAQVTAVPEPISA